MHVAHIRDASRPQPEAGSRKKELEALGAGQKKNGFRLPASVTGPRAGAADAVAPRKSARFGIGTGAAYPLGATWNGAGVNFAVFSAHATRIEICIFDRSGRQELERLQLPEHSDEVWHGYVPDLPPGTLYGLRVHGPYAPDAGHRFNHHKLLLDPYAKALAGAVSWHPALFGYRLRSRDGDLSFDTRDSARYVPRCRVVDTAFTWGDRPLPRTPWDRTVLYELHVRGFTRLHPAVPEEFRGTVEGLANRHVIRHLHSLGVTALELLPVHAFVDEAWLLDRGLRNYWGYNSIGWFAPMPRYLASGSINEFKATVNRLHAAGLEVLLDVVYNHTAEGNELGPTLSLKGIDNSSYYRLQDNRRYYVNDTGTGNTLQLFQPRVLQLVLDSLRYWALEMGVDGYRFDLATVLGRELAGFDAGSGFLDACLQDPVLSRLKLVAEPWDLGPGGYQVGNFPPGWAEWNDQYRDTVRSFWKGDAGHRGGLAGRLCASPDLFRHRGRRPWASVNFVTVHDGFTLNDLVSYNGKHNEANGDENRDGPDDNRSWNHGEEGPTNDSQIAQLRERQKRNFLLTLLLSQGTPLLLAGDEFGHTQRGNNNAYAQDNPLTWLDWSAIAPDGGHLMNFVRRALRLRRRFGAFRQAQFLDGAAKRESPFKDVTWLNASGGEMTAADWADPEGRFLAMMLACAPEEAAAPAAAALFLLLLNAGHEAVSLQLPAPVPKGVWNRLLDTMEPEGEPMALAGGASLLVPERAAALYHLELPPGDAAVPPASS